jgi:hypothetical protein
VIVIMKFAPQRRSGAAVPHAVTWPENKKARLAGRAL